MREFFRAQHIHAVSQNKHLDGTWVYGYLCDENHINTIDQDEYGENFTSEMLIDTQTVCQCTGLTDKNGRKIFEGDIIKVDDDWTGAVYWDVDDTAFNVDPHGDGYMEYLGRLITDDDVAVIGNIYDNPELMKG